MNAPADSIRADLADMAQHRRAHRNTIAARVVELRQKGEETPVIAQRLGVSLRLVVKHLTQAGMTQPMRARRRER